MSLNDTVLEGSNDFFKQQTNRGKNNMIPKQNTADIALVCYEHDYTYDKPGQVRSGDWVVGIDKRANLIGSNVILTEKQTAPAYLGGKIIGINPKHDNKVELIFKEDNSLVGNTDAIDHPKWGQEKCYL